MADTKSNVSKHTNLEPNIAGALAYLIPPITGIIFFIMEKDDKSVRFHAFQSILFGVAAYIAWAIATALVVIVIGALLLPLVSIAVFIFWALLMWKAYNGEQYELPVIGRMAKEQISK